MYDSGIDLGMPDLAEIARTGILRAYQPPGVLYPPQSPDEQTSMKRCSAIERQPFQAFLAAGQRLGGPFAKEVAAIQNSSAVLATVPALRACAARNGWPDERGDPADINNFGDFSDWVDSHLYSASPDSTSESSIAAVNRHWAPIFVTCATPTVTVMEKLQLAQQKTYLAQHQQQLAALVGLARTALATAEAQAVSTTFPSTVPSLSGPAAASTPSGS